MNCTPLHSAATKGHPMCCERLLERDADINSLDLARSTPLHIAARQGFPSVVQV